MKKRKMLRLIQRQQRQIEQLQARVSALEPPNNVIPESFIKDLLSSSSAANPYRNLVR
jgi:hypothetical protein